MENNKNARIRKYKILTFVPPTGPFAGELRPRFGLEISEELEGGISSSSSNALMSALTLPHAGASRSATSVIDATAGSALFSVSPMSKAPQKQPLRAPAAELKILLVFEYE